MECTLMALLACFSWSGFYIDLGANQQDVGEWRIEHHEGGGIVPGSNVQETWSYDAPTNSPQNLYGRFGLGWQSELQTKYVRVVFEAEAWHTSSMATGRDRGINGFGLSAKIFPFARR